jgi:NADH-quinone oxidoreductase subunit H
MWSESWNWAQALTDLQTSLGAPEPAAWFISYFIGAFILVNTLLVLAMLLIWLTRKIVSRMQDRLGPNRLGPWGLVQTVADVLKLMTKEIITPRDVDLVAYNLAPIFGVVGVLIIFAVLPFAPGLSGADLNVGVLFIPALGSVGIMAALMAGWSSNNKYALLSGFRVVAQLLSYEIPLVLAMLLPVLLAGTMSLQGISEAQSSNLFGFNLGIGWYAFIMPAALIIFFISSLAEAEQPPFDLLEAESEIIAGFHIEYSGMRFAMFFLAQFLNTWFLSAIAAVLFLGGWQGPGVDQVPLLGFVYLTLKTVVFYVIVMWIKGTVPRVRIDQMMAFAWKVLIPLVLALVLWAFVVLKIPAPGTLDDRWVQYPLLLLGNLIVIYIVSRVLSSYYRTEAMRTKRAFTPRSLIGTMQPASEPTSAATMHAGD